MAEYRNYEHYIGEGWQKEPKESFKAIAEIINSLDLVDSRLLDVGCATGELLGYLKSKFPSFSFTGVDVFDELLDVGSNLLPGVQFIKGSALDLPKNLCGSFDIAVAIGVMSIFNEDELHAFWGNLLGVLKPGGVILVLSPLNEFGVDAVIRHRKRQQNRLLDWEGGWNIFSFETIREVLSGFGQEVSFKRFKFASKLYPKEDPIRTWTLPTGENSLQLTNGLKLLVDHYFMLVIKH